MQSLNLQTSRALNYRSSTDGVDERRREGEGGERIKNGMREQWESLV